MRPLLLLAALLGVGCRYELELPFLVDESFADFSAGTLQDSGAKIYVSAKGNVQLVDRLDLDGDGWPDLPFAPSDYGGDFRRSVPVILSSPKAPHDFASPRTLTLPSVNARFLGSADLDDDGHADLFVANTADAISSRIDSFLYRGAPGGPAPEERQALPTVGAWGVAIADLNRDGHLDLVVANNFDRDQSPLYNISSYLYWGSATGFDTKNRLSLPARGASGVAVADLDEDGRLDLVFASQEQDEGASYREKRTTESVIHWGALAGFDGSLGLPSFGAVDVGVADLDRDGALDLVFANRGMLEDATGTASIYWGDRGDRRGYGVSRRSELPTPRAYGLSIGDLNGDGELDLVFPAAGAPDGLTNVSLIYWGPWSRALAASKPTTLPTCIQGCAADAQCKNACFNYGSLDWQGLTTATTLTSLISDLDGDGHPDLVFVRDTLDSRVYWGPWKLTSNPDPSYIHFRGMTDLPSGMAVSTYTPEPGSVRDRSAAQSFVSRVHRTPELDHEPEILSLSWQASVPPETRLRFQLRSAENEAALESSPWGPLHEGTQALLSGQRGRLVQYRALFEARTFASSPVLDRVVIRYR